ncbi:sensor histidine kinase [Streptomyces sp. DSM 116496]|uniref:sensor histidine kinase n=1 Tax=Streptomyces stoeckheimensis TaxID=3344656 RepID=UPI0038B2C108
MEDGAEEPLDTHLIAKTRRLSGARISQGIAPIHSVRAGALLFQVATSHLIRIASPHPEDQRCLMKMLPVLQSSITQRLEAGSTGHDLFLLDVVRDATRHGRDGMAREIHDRIGSSASLALRQLELYELTRHPSGTDPRLEALKQAILETLYTTRDIVTDLRTRAEATQSLYVSLSAFVSAMAMDDVQVDIHVTDPGDLLPDELTEDLYLMLRECLRNAFTHARSARIDMEVRVEAGRVDASVRDDGTGFDPHAHRRGNGLSSLTERTKLLGGRLTIDSAPGQGTAIALAIPFDTESHAHAN